MLYLSFIPIKLKIIHNNNKLIIIWIIKMDSVITLTFGDMAENHKGMEQIGQIVGEGEGFNMQNLLDIKTFMENKNCNCELLMLSDNNIPTPEACVLIIKDGVNKLLEGDGYTDMDLFEEQKNLDYDKKAYMYGSVRNKNARWNLCYDNESREPDYLNGMGRIIGFTSIPITNLLRLKFEEYFGPKATNLKIEANYYYDVNKCGIGFHGDSERRKVIGVRLGNKKQSIPLFYQWYLNSNPIGNKKTVQLNNGDIYVMSEKAVGTDWKRKKIYTLRHATGCDKFTNIN